MKFKNILKLGILAAWFFAFVPCGAMAGDESIDFISPQFVSGAEWDLRIRYRDLEGAIRENSTLFTYRVESVNEDENSWSISVFADSDPSRKMYISGSITPFSLFQEDNTSIIEEKVKPAITRKSIFPQDSPHFPLIPEEENAYKIKYKMNDGLFFSKEFVQACSQTDAAQIPENELGLSGAVLKVSYSISEDSDAVSSGFTQYWSTDYPWAVYGENAMMVYWMVRYEIAE